MTETAEETFEHVARVPLPWREESPTTECGLDGRRFPGISHQELERKVKRLGKQRASLFVCMTCWGRTAGHYWWSAFGESGAVSWDATPSTVLKREIEHETNGRPRGDGGYLIDRELRALVALVDAHREEFAGLLTGLQAITDLSEARRKARASR